jgi:hypothetical protein
VAGVTVDGFLGDDIQRAVDSLESGGVVQLRAGTYLLNRAVRLATGVVVVGDGADRTLIELLPGSDSHLFENDDPARGNERIELRGLSLDGNRATQHRRHASAKVFAFGAFLWNVNRVVIADVDARQIGQSAIQVNGCRDVTVTRLRATDMGWGGIGAARTNHLSVSEVLVERAGLDGMHSAIHLGSGTGMHVVASVVGCSANGIMLDSRVAPIAEVVIEAAAHQCSRGAAVIGFTDHRAGEMLISGDFSHNRECGVFISNASNVFVVDAKIEFNDEAGVVLQGDPGAKHCLIADCTIAGSPTAIVERHASSDNYRVRNTITEAVMWRVPVAAAGP